MSNVYPRTLVAVTDSYKNVDISPHSTFSIKTKSN
jgi:hypothetical protein